MKRFHIGALICFAVALLLYFVSWLPGAWALGILGFLFEVAAWAQVLGTARNN
jgi:membrane associated rhomboid family serine protease